MRIRTYIKVKRREIEKFSVGRFKAFDSDMRFFTEIADYQTFDALYNFLKPRPDFLLDYRNGFSNVSKVATYVISRGSPR